MALFEPNFMLQLRRLSLAAKWTNRLSPVKAPASPLLAGHRDYSPGDDYRMIDWHICARHDELVTRQRLHEPERHVYLLVDCSASMSIGSPSKFDAARRAAAALAYAALAELSRVAAVCFADRLLDRFGPVSSLSQMPRLAAWLESLAVRGPTTDLPACAKQFCSQPQHRGTVCVLSDLHGRDTFRKASDRLLQSGYQPACIRIYDTSEANPEFLGDCQLVDVENGAAWQARLTERDLHRYRNLYQAHVRSIRRYCSGRRLEAAEIASDLSLDRQLLEVVRAGRSQ